MTELFKRYSFNENDFRDVRRYTLDQEYNCDDGCDPYCRCGRIVGILFDTKYETEELMSVMEYLYVGPSDTVTKYLAQWFLKLVWKNADWGYESCGGYYGEELEKVLIHNIDEIRLMLSDFEACETNIERVHWLLEAENQLPLPENLKKFKGIQVEPVFITDVNTPLNNQLHSYYVDQYKAWFDLQIEAAEKLNNLNVFQEAQRHIMPLCRRVGSGVTAKYEIIDGRHRFDALTQSYTFQKKPFKIGWIFVAYLTP